MTPLTEGMLLYHGSYCEVARPDLAKCAKFKDFGQGFYLTTEKRQATSFAKTSARKAKLDGRMAADANCAWVSVFRVVSLAGLSCFSFQDADAEWLHCVVAHRRRDVFVEVRRRMSVFDVIGGKVANDDTNATITAYMGHVFGRMGSAEADRLCISLLIPGRLKDQFCFRSKNALRGLEFIKSARVSLEGR